MKIKIIYISPNGTTKITAEEIRKGLTAYGLNASLYDLGSEPYRSDFSKLSAELDGADLIGFGSPVYHMQFFEPMSRFLDHIAFEGAARHRFKTFLFANYAGITSGKSFLKAENQLQKAGLDIVGAMKLYAPHFHHEEAFPSDDALRTISELCEHISRTDLDRVKSGCFEPKAAVNIVYPLVHLIGKMRELPIFVHTSDCRGCGICAAECPSAAISVGDVAEINFNKCLHCYHCSLCCPFNAIECPVQRLDAMIAQNKKIIGTEYPQNQLIS